METTTTKLFWDEGGRIGCAQHRPYPGSDTWVWDAWGEITEADLRGYERTVGRPARCETCAAIERRRTADLAPPF